MPHNAHHNHLGNLQVGYRLTNNAVDPSKPTLACISSIHFTYWDSAIVALEVMTALNVEKAFVLGTSQSGWLVVRTSMDTETPESREKGCCDPVLLLSPFARSGRVPVRRMLGRKGRRKARMAVLCLMPRDSLTLRLSDVTCPIYWPQGTEDASYECQVQHEHIESFTASKDKKLRIVEGGAHYLNATNFEGVNEAILEMIKKHAS
ncbi:hypothetical protein BU25DRAFT_442367 [Macroventuria anomochaeta]|uniref:Uncharacterized protein n=1 Tax=Macroventuria anomochaeta TaxID=301207 RepID=A0ACB6RS08_9PLEO|nr:uncharacterized protein BU25DRAFT_442367 [Macroventuria anomochaeta]KAF2623924.1 hypothetical protein BU25DRAFT_442367 [Macroventuria anomochaeta]